MAVVRMLLAVLLGVTIVTAQTDDEVCGGSPLGMEAGSITNGQITASSVFNVRTEPYYARLHRGEGDGGWTASTQDNNQYLTIDLAVQTEITAVATQGRQGSEEWVTQYTLQYSDDGERWLDYTERGSKKTFDGNTDAETVVKHELSDEIIARYIRFNPKGFNKQMSMRVEAYGCIHDADTATFDGNSYVIFDVSPSNQHLAIENNEIKFRLKTNRPDGVILAGSGTQTDYIVLELVDGYLFLNIDLGSSSKIEGATQVALGSLLDDNHWHNVHIVRRKKQITMTVDRHTVTATTEGDFERLDLDKVITFGGAANFDDPGISVEKNFVGCLENVYFNNDNILRSLEESSPNFRLHGDIQYVCQDQVIVPITFPSREAYLRLVGRASNQFLVQFDFRAFDTDGLIVFNQLQDDGWIMVSLQDGRLLTDVITATAGPIKMEAGENLNDGQWHSIRVEVKNNFAQLRIDGREWDTDRLINIQTTTRYYVGGAPTSVSEEGGFRGCMKDLYLGTTKLDFLALQRGEVNGAVNNDVSIDTCGIVDRCSPTPCEHGGKCQQDWTDFQCDCSSTGYGGATCHTSLNERSCEMYKQLGRSSGYQYIDPDLSGPLAPFQVYCDMGTDIRALAKTEVSHDSEQEITVNNFGAPGSYRRNIDYYADMDQLGAMIGYSEYCTQSIKYMCRSSRLLNSPSGDPYGWWVGRTNDKMTYWGGAGPGTRKCQCGIEETCREVTKWCNCDSAATVWETDEGDLIDKEYLPVKQLRFGDTEGATAEGKHTLGKLICEGDTTLDNVATFRTKQSHIRYPVFEGRLSGDASFEFKTTAESGVFLFNRGDIDYIRVELLSTNVIQFSYNVGNGRVAVKSTSSTPLNDDKWHMVKVSRNMKEAVLQVDNNSPSVEPAQTGHYQLNLKGNLYVGSTDVSTDGFVGCMRALFANGILMDLKGKAAVTYGVSPGCIGQCDRNPCYSGGDCIEEYSGFKCNCTMTSFVGPICATEVGATFPRNGRIRYIFPVEESIDSSIEEVRVGFKTEVKQGTILRIQSRDFDDFFEIKLNSQGNINVSFDLGEGVKHVANEQDYADGQFHDLRVTRNERNVMISIDTYAVTRDTRGEMTQTQLNAPGTLFIGRYENENGFTGCISRLEFNGIYPLKKAFESPRPNNVVLEGGVEKSMCGVEPSTLPPTTKEPYPPTSPWSYNASANPFPSSGASTSYINDGAVIGCVVAVLAFAVIVLLVVIGRYIARHKGSYDTNEAKGAETAPDADAAVRQQPQVEKKKEWYI
ncbi:contactin-associated protein-like 2 isoform X2 [Glandiceps talaboti]